MCFWVKRFTEGHKGNEEKTGYRLLVIGYLGRCAGYLLFVMVLGFS